MSIAFSSAVFVKSCDIRIKRCITLGSVIPVISINLLSEFTFDKYLTSFIPPGSLFK